MNLQSIIQAVASIANVLSVIVLGVGYYFMVRLYRGKGFRLAATRRPALLELAGPAVLLAVIGTWTSLVAVGFV